MSAVFKVARGFCNWTASQYISFWKWFTVDMVWLGPQLWEVFEYNNRASKCFVLGMRRPIGVWFCELNLKGYLSMRQNFCISLYSTMLEESTGNWHIGLHAHTSFCMYRGQLLSSSIVFYMSLKFMDGQKSNQYLCNYLTASFGVGPFVTFEIVGLFII